MNDLTVRKRDEHYIEVVIPTPALAADLGNAHRAMLKQLGVAGEVVSNDDAYEVVVGADEVILRARVTYPENPDAWTFNGAVRDSGGGEVVIVVSRDTDSYPMPGDDVFVTVHPRPRPDVRPR